MIGCPPDWRLEKQLNIGGIHYDICLTPHGSGFRATWICQKCAERAAFDPFGDTAEQAVDAAKIGVRVHHDFVHATVRIENSNAI